MDESYPQGQRVGIAGDTGTGADSVHLHLELRRGNNNATCVYPTTNCFFGDPIDWDGLDIDGWRIFGYLKDTEGIEAWNYDGSAVQGNVDLFFDFPYDDSGTPRQAAVARVGETFICTSATDCEDNAQSQKCWALPTPTPGPTPMPDCSSLTQFAKVGDGGVLAGAAGSTWPPPGAGHLTSTNQVAGAVGGIAELPGVASGRLGMDNQTGAESAVWVALGAGLLLGAIVSGAAWHLRKRSR